MEEMINILLCEDQDIFSEGLKNSLNKEKDMKVVKTITDASLILKELKEGDYNLLLTDIITKNKHNARR